MQVGFTRDFQVQLLAHLIRDEQFFSIAANVVHLNDFDLPACQFVYEAVKLYYQEFKRLPDNYMLQQHVLNCIQGGHTVTRLTPEEYESVAMVLQMTLNIPKLDVPYYQSQLSAYLKSIRLSKELSASQANLAMGNNADDIIRRVIKLNSDVSIGGTIIDSAFENPEFLMEDIPYRRITTGLRRFNSFIDGGLGRGEIGMVTACPGVGKTTTLINFMAGAIQAGIRCLFITLELKGPRIKNRLLSITSGVINNILKRPQPQWPEYAKQAMLRVTNGQYPFRDYASIVDFSDATRCLADVESAIVDWKRKFEQKCGSAEEAKCFAVYLDWLDRLDPAKGIFYSKEFKEDSLLKRLMESLALLSRKHDVALWTATQGTRDADGREVLAMKHSAYAYHKNDALDVGLALGVVNNDNGNNTLQVVNPETGPTLSRYLKFNITKNRDNPNTSFDVYQDSTLRFWDSPADAQHIQTLLTNMELERKDTYLNALMNTDINIGKTR